MDGVTQVFGAAVLLFLLSYIAFNIESKHKYLRTVLIIFIFLGLLSIPKFMLDNNDYCEIVVTAQNTSITDYTTYEYSRECFSNTTNTTEVSFITTLWVLLFFVFYTFFYAMYEIFYEKIQAMVKRYSRGRRKK